MFWWIFLLSRENENPENKSRSYERSKIRELIQEVLKDIEFYSS